MINIGQRLIITDKLLLIIEKKLRYSKHFIRLSKILIFKYLYSNGEICTFLVQNCYPTCIIFSRHQHHIIYSFFLMNSKLSSIPFSRICASKKYRIRVSLNILNISDIFSSIYRNISFK